MVSKLYRDEAVVLRTYKLGEADRLLVLLTRHHGQVRAVAKGVARTSSRFGGRLQPFNLVDLQLHKGRNLDTVTQVQTLEAYAGPLMGNYSAYTCAATMAETAQRLTEEVNAYEGANSQYLLLVGALNALARARHPSGLVLDSYLLRSLSLAGWAVLTALYVGLRALMNISRCKTVGRCAKAVANLDQFMLTVRLWCYWVLYLAATGPPSMLVRRWCVDRFPPSYPPT